HDQRLGGPAEAVEQQDGKKFGVGAPSFIRYTRAVGDLEPSIARIAQHVQRIAESITQAIHVFASRQPVCDARDHAHFIDWLPVLQASYLDGERLSLREGSCPSLALRRAGRLDNRNGVDV